MRYFSLLVTILLFPLWGFTQNSFVTACNSDNSPSFQKGSFSAFSAMCQIRDKRWLLSGNLPGKGAFLSLFDVDSMHVEPLTQLSSDANPFVNAAYPTGNAAFWLAGHTQGGKQPLPWLANVDINGSIAFEKIFPAQKKGTFYDLIISRDTLISIGRIDERLVAAVVPAEGEVLVHQARIGTLSTGQATLATLRGDILIAGWEVGRRGERKALVWQFEPSTGDFQEVFERPMSESWAICRTFDGKVAVVGTGKVDGRKHIWLVWLKKNERSPTQANKWQKVDSLIIDHPARLMKICGMLQAADQSLMIAGSSSGFHPFANATQTFLLRVSGSGANLQHQLSFVEIHDKGSAALTFGRCATNEFLLGGYVGVSEKNKGRLLSLRADWMNPSLPMSSFGGEEPMPPIIYGDTLEIHVTLTLPQFEENAFKDLKYTLNDSPEIDAYERRKDSGGAPTLKLSEIKLENSCCEYRLQGSLPMYDRGVMNTFQLIDYSNGRYAKSEIQTVYTAPALYIIGVGNNFDGLKHADKDVKAFCDSLKKEEGKSFRSVQAWQLIQADSIGKESIGILFDYVRNKVKPKQGDLFIFFMSSHCHERDGKLSFACQNRDTLFFDNDIFEHILRLKCRKLIFLDACQYSSTGSLPQIPQSPNVFMALSCKPGGRSFESDFHQHGIFTRAMLDVLKDACAQTTGYTSPSELFQATYKKVHEMRQIKEETENLNVPQSHGGENLQDIPFIYRSKQ